MATDDDLKRYRDKRNFKSTTEPATGGKANENQRRFVIQKHWARQLHYDFRLELGGTLKSWAVPKGPSLDPKDKRMAVQVEDHPLSYGDFEGEIAKGNYGAGTVIVWDSGTWEPIGDPKAGCRDGKLKFELHGEKLKGGWTLVRMHGRESDKQPPWLLIKEKDDAARAAADYSVVDALPDSVIGAAPKTVAAAKSRVAASKPRTKSRAASASLALPAAATKAELPAALKPQLATLTEAPPARAAEWFYEIKFDGYRLLARIERGRARLFTRNGHDWTARMPKVAKAVEALPLASGWLDGEVVLPRASGVPDFQALQNAFDGDDTDRLVYYLFDLPFADGHDLRQAPLVERRAALESLFAKLAGDAADTVRFSAALEVPPKSLLASACQLGFEGVIGKRRDSAYVSRRSSDWIKLKCSHRQEFVICGYTDPQGSRSGLGSLLLGVHDDDGKLTYAGNVGTGFTEKSLADLTRRLQAIETKAAPFADTKGIPAKGRHWVEPKLLAEVSFAEWTTSGRIRHSVFHGLRADKKPQAIGREKPAPPPGTTGAQAASSKTPRPSKKAAGAVDVPELPNDLRVTHPGRVIDKASGTTKLDLVRYYARAADLMLPHLKGRPVSLVRAPQGVTGGQFFQKHADAQDIAGIKRIDPAIDARLDPSDGALLEVVNASGLLNAAQLNTIELHTWNARSRSIATPDRMTFDLDPGDGVAFSKVRDGAHLVCALLHELGLPAFVKTSGGKGLHVVVPIRRQLDWDTVKDFSKRIVEHLARNIPARFVAKSGPKNRVGKIFVDYLRNGFGATTVAAWSARARPGMGVSVPIGWEELDRIDSGDHFALDNIDERLAIGNARWDGYEKARRALGPAMKKLAAAAPALKPRKR